jgi:hypothetical protein
MLIDPEIERLFDEQATGPRYSPDVGFNAYCQIPAVNWSTLRAMGVSPLAYLHAVTTKRGRDDDTDPMKEGRAVHTKVLEPHLWNAQSGERFTFYSERRQGKVWDSFKATYHDYTVLSRAGWDRADAMADAVMRHPVARSYLLGGESEKTITWTDRVTGLDCKARADKLHRRAIVDLKTTIDLSPRFLSTMFRYGYVSQVGGMYRRGALAAGLIDEDAESVIIAVQSRAPYDVGVFVLDDYAIEYADKRVGDLLGKVRECTDANDWPGLYPSKQCYTIPDWAQETPEITFEEEPDNG